jgi:hypothetical protein
MFSRKLTRFVAAGGAAVAVAIGGFAIANSSSNSSASGTATAAQVAGSHPGARSAASGIAPAPHAGAQAQTAKSGQLPPNWRPGTGTIITGAAADKAKAVALSKYTGTVNRVLQLSDGSYAVHMIGTSGPHHVFVSKDFKVITGTA